MRRGIVAAVAVLCVVPWVALALLYVVPPGNVFLFRLLSAAALLGLCWGAWRLSAPYTVAWPLRLPRVLLLVFFGCLLVGLFLLARLSSWEPHGMWDAWAVWNHKARTYSLSFFQGYEFFLHRPDFAHSGYPPFFVLLLTFAAINLGSWSVAVPIAIVFGYYCLSVVIIADLAGRAYASARWDAVLAVFLVVMAPPLMRQAAFQVADFPLSVHLMAACYLLISPPVEDQGTSLPRVQWILLGLFFLTLPAIKKEGAVIAGLVLPFFAIAYRSWLERRAVPYFILGALLPIMISIFFRLVVPPDQFYPFAPLEFLARASDPARLKFMGMSFLIVHVVMMGGVVGYTAVRALGSGNAHARWIFLGWSAAFIAYHGIFLITPLDFEWQMRTAFERVTLQHYPALGVVLLASFVFPLAKSVDS